MTIARILAVTILWCAATTVSAAAQGSTKLAVGPDAGGYQCPDGRQLYVKSCYDASPQANCGIVNMHLPMRGGFQPETTDTRANISASVASCKVYPVNFRDGVVSLDLPKQQSAQASPAGKAAQAPAAKPATPAPKSGGAAAADPTKLVRMSPKGVQPITRYVLLDSASPSPSVPNAVEILSLMIFADGQKENAAARGAWVGYAVTCKQPSLRLVMETPVDDKGAQGTPQVFNTPLPLVTGSEVEQIANIACGAAPPAGPRLKSAAAAITDAATKPKPTPRGKIKLAVPVKAKIRLPETEAEKTFFQAIETNRMQAAVNASITPPGGQPVRVTDLTDEQGMTALHWAASNRSMGALRWLLDKGADGNLADKKGRTPLKIALDNKHLDAVQMLLDRGADPNLVWPYHPDDLKGFKTTRELVDFMLEAGVPASK